MFKFAVNFNRNSSMRLVPASSRGHSDHGWLKSNFSFSFSDYYDAKRNNFGALRVLNDDIIEKGAGFPLHGHKNMEIVTVMLDGTLAHKDSMGNVGNLNSFDVQAMSAGSGIRHSEYNPSQEVSCHLYQIWITTEEDNIEPAYDQITLNRDDVLNKFYVVAGAKKLNSKLSINQNAAVSRCDGLKGETVTYKQLLNGNGLYLQVAAGKIKVSKTDTEKENESITAAVGDAIEIESFTDLKVTFLEDSIVVGIEVPMNL